jgi:regulator of replication initiation timing
MDLSQVLYFQKLLENHHKIVDDTIQDIRVNQGKVESLILENEALTKDNEKLRNENAELKKANSLLRIENASLIENLKESDTDRTLILQQFTENLDAKSRLTNCLQEVR